MATEHKMIEPFHPHQVREEASRIYAEDGFLKKVISYGTSSYGYDVRVGNNFKIFTNINSTVVDPKNFDDKNFVDVESDDFIIIPPNSFALAQTIEYFRIPRNVLTVCLGKSTYARCFSGKTKIALANGTTVTFLDMIERAKAGERFFGYSVSKEGKIAVSELVQPRKIGTEKVIEVVLDNDEVIRCTPDHKFILNDGSHVEAQNLTIGQSLWPLYRKYFRGIGTNHKVKEIRQVEGIEDVYCLTAPEFGNFALDAGVFVLNCGIIVNVTPFEPEWEGQVTLEFSNTTPLPAKIYANEGCAQVLFFESDEVCEVSYKDRAGKYQGQTGITLPQA